MLKVSNIMQVEINSLMWYNMHGKLTTICWNISRECSCTLWDFFFAYGQYIRKVSLNILFYNCRNALWWQTKIWDLTVFLISLGLFQYTSLSTGFTNLLTEFQKYMTFILYDKILTKANIFIDNLPIKEMSMYMMRHHHIW